MALFCSNCGSKTVANATFCPSCGKAIAGAGAAEATSQATSTPVTKRELPKLNVSKKTLTLVGGGLVIILAIVAAFAIFVKSSPTKDNAASYLVTPAMIGLGAVDSGKPDFSGQVLSDCPVDTEISGLFSSGTTWAEGGIKSPDGDKKGFHIHQRLFEASTETDVASLNSLLSQVATNTACDSSSIGSYVSFWFDYENGRSITDAYGVNVEGYVIDINTKICLTTCSTTQSALLVAQRGKIVDLIEFGGDPSRFGAMETAVTELLKKFAG